MTKITGPGEKRTIKSCMDFVKCMTGEMKPKPKRKSPTRTNLNNEMVEKELERQIILRLKRAGYWVFKTGGSGAFDYNTKYNEAGCADLMVIGKPGGVTFLEVKQPLKRHAKNGGLTGKQPEFRRICETSSVRYAIVYSVSEAIEMVER